MTKPTDKTRTVRLTLAQWNSVLCAMSEARRYNVEHGYIASAGAVEGLKIKIEDQILKAVEKAFCEEYPEEHRVTHEMRDS